MNDMHFTQAKIRDLKSPLQGRVVYRDIKEKGLSLYITYKGIKTFFYRKRIDGKDTRVIIGNFPDISVEDARRKFIDIRAQIANGNNPHEDKKKLKHSISFRDICHQYMEKYSKVHKKSWESDQYMISRFLDRFMKKKFSDITLSMIKKLQEDIYKNHGLYQANRCIALLSTIYTKAIEWGWNGENIASRVKKFKEKSRDRFLQPDELQALFEALALSHNDIVRDYIYISLFTGARRSNVQSMRWVDINFNNNTWFIEDTKNGESMTIPLHDQVVKILQLRKEKNKELSYNNHTYVFPSKGVKGHLVEPKKAWNTIRIHASILLWKQDNILNDIIINIQGKLPKYYGYEALYKELLKEVEKKNMQLPKAIMDVRLHDLRRTLGSWQAASGSSTTVIGKSLGHKTQQATAIYARLNLDPVRQSVNTAVDKMLKYV